MDLTAESVEIEYIRYLSSEFLNVDPCADVRNHAQPLGRFSSQLNPLFNALCPGVEARSRHLVALKNARLQSETINSIWRQMPIGLRRIAKPFWESYHRAGSYSGITREISESSCRFHVGASKDFQTHLNTCVLETANSALAKYGIRRGRFVAKTWRLKDRLAPGKLSQLLIKLNPRPDEAQIQNWLQVADDLTYWWRLTFVLAHWPCTFEAPKRHSVQEVEITKVPSNGYAQNQTVLELVQKIEKLGNSVDDVRGFLERLVGRTGQSAVPGPYNEYDQNALIAKLRGELLAQIFTTISELFGGLEGRIFAHIEKMSTQPKIQPPQIDFPPELPDSTADVAPSNGADLLRLIKANTREAAALSLGLRAQIWMKLLRVDELRDAARSCSVSPRGAKREMISRIRRYLKSRLH